MNQNICTFLPKPIENRELNIFHFVYETKPEIYRDMSCATTYKMHLVTSGSGIFRTAGNSYSLAPGDIFFCTPSMPFSIEETEALEFMYISYLGDRANLLMDQAKVSRSHPYFPGFVDLIPIWIAAIQNSSLASPLGCEGLLLFSFSALSPILKKNETKSDELPLLIRKYIEDHFSDTSLSLKTLSAEFSYSEKHISTLFKKKFKIGIAKYISTLRLQHACSLMEQGFTCIKDISFLCGFADPLYFSRLFKAQVGLSPRTFLAQVEH